MDSTVFRPLHTASCTVRCSHCNLREICLPVGLTRDELEHIDGRLVASRRKLARGDALFRVGDRCDALFAVWTGFFKTVIASKQGREQVTGFQMGGELLGLSGIDTGRHEVDAIESRGPASDQTSATKRRVCIVTGRNDSRTRRTRA